MNNNVKLSIIILLNFNFPSFIQFYLIHLPKKILFLWLHVHTIGVRNFYNILSKTFFFYFSFINKIENELTTLHFNNTRAKQSEANVFTITFHVHGGHVDFCS